MRNAAFALVAGVFQAIADIYLNQAEALEAEAQALRDGAEAKEQQAAILENEAAQLLAEAEQARQEAQALRTEAEDLIVLVEQAETLASEYRALAENPPETKETTVFVYDLNGQLIGEYDEQGNATREYVYLDGQPLAMLQGDEIYYYHNDHLGTPKALTGQNRQIVWRADYNPFGMANITTEQVINNLRFPGQYFDSATDLHYNYFRYYNPGTGRYQTSDPIGLDGGLGTYTYVSNNPIIKIDPFGLVEWHGTQTTFAAGEGGGAVRLKFMLQSECVNGKQATAEVVAGGFTLNVGIPASATHSRSVEFVDNRSEPDPFVFSGSAKYLYASWAMTFAGVSYQVIHLGDAEAIGWGKQMGWDGSIAGGAGMSTVVEMEIINCECDTK